MPCSACGAVSHDTANCPVMAGQPLIERPAHPAATALRRMADHVERNALAGFGGCVVIIPPEGGGNPIEILTIADQPDIGQFFGAITARIAVRTAELDGNSRQQQAFQRR